jgi:nucleoside-diphosphate-sugar epimerase
MPLIVIRPRTLLGEGRLGIFQILFDWISTARSVYVIGGGEGGFQFLHALDMMDFYMLALDTGRPGVYNVGTDRFGTLRAALENLIAYAGTSSRVRSLPVGPTIAALTALDKLKLSPLAPWHYLTYHKPFAFEVEPLSPWDGSRATERRDDARELRLVLGHATRCAEVGAPEAGPGRAPLALKKPREPA